MTNSHLLTTSTTAPPTFSVENTDLETTPMYDHTHLQPSDGLTVHRLRLTAGDAERETRLACLDRCFRPHPPTPRTSSSSFS